MQWTRASMKNGTLRTIQEPGSFVPNAMNQRAVVRKTPFGQKTVNRFARTVQKRRTTMQNPFREGSQNYRLLEALKHGPLYNYQIARRFNCLAHTRRLKDLRERGYPVVTEPVPGRKGVYVSYLK